MLNGCSFDGRDSSLFLVSAPPLRTAAHPLPAHPAASAVSASLSRRRIILCETTGRTSFDSYRIGQGSFRTPTTLNFLDTDIFPPRSNDKQQLRRHDSSSSATPTPRHPFHSNGRWITGHLASRRPAAPHVLRTYDLCIATNLPHCSNREPYL